MSRQLEYKRALLLAACIMTAVLLCVPLLLPITAYEGGTISVDAPAISADCAILIEASTGEIVWSRNADEKRSMASTTKIMTALVAIENCDISKTVSVSPDAVGIEGSSIYLYEGEKLKMEDLLYAMLLESANDAAAAIAIEVGGSIEAFAEMMNEKAAELGLENTHFTNPHGLDDAEHYTTAEELAKIALSAMENETFREIVSTYKKTIPLNETEGVRLLINHNKLLKSYDGCVGVKTGYTKKSGRCLVSAAIRDGVELICVTLDAPDDWQDHSSLFDYGFSLYESRLLCSAGEFKYIQSVVGGNEDYVILTNTDEVRVTLPKGSGETKCTVELSRFSYAPIQKGDCMGRLVYRIDGETVAEVPVIASYGVERVSYKRSLWDRFISLFFK